MSTLGSRVALQSAWTPLFTNAYAFGTGVWWFARTAHTGAGGVLVSTLEFYPTPFFDLITWVPLASVDSVPSAI